MKYVLGSALMLLASVFLIKSIIDFVKRWKSRKNAKENKTHDQEGTADSVDDKESGDH